MLRDREVTILSQTLESVQGCETCGVFSTKIIINAKKCALFQQKFLLKLKSAFHGQLIGLTDTSKHILL